jgi:hypothetical protein
MLWLLFAHPPFLTPFERRCCNKIAHMHSIKGSEQFANTYVGEYASPIWGNIRMEKLEKFNFRVGNLAHQVVKYICRVSIYL